MFFIMIINTPIALYKALYYSFVEWFFTFIAASCMYYYNFVKLTYEK